MSPGLVLPYGRHHRPLGTQRRTATSAFDPLTLSPLLWLKADDGTGGVIDGDAVGTWTDKSGGGHNATQATGTKKPLYKTGIQNGKPVVRFDGVDDYLVAAYGSAQAQTNVVFVVANIKGNAQYVFDGGSGNREALADGLATSGKVGLFAGSTIEATIAKPTGMSVWTCVFAGASSALYKDGASFASGNAGANNASGITLGISQGTVTGALNGDIAEVLVYHASLSTPDQQSVEGYLRGKWGTP